MGNAFEIVVWSQIPLDFDRACEKAEEQFRNICSSSEPAWNPYAVTVDLIRSVRRTIDFGEDREYKYVFSVTAE